MQIILWLVAAMSAWVPTKSEARYFAIARDVHAVAMDPEEPPLFKGDHARERTALLLLAIAGLESSYRADVEDGRTRGDHGSSVCMMQVNLPGDARIVLDGELYRWTRGGSEGWGKAELASDRAKCFRAGLHIARESFKVCGDLSLYTSGKCDRLERTAVHRLDRARAWWKKQPIVEGVM